MKGRVLIIAGSDSGGGAGIQADIKAVTALDGYAATALTALTAQNTCGVSAIHEVPADFIAEQIRVVLQDIGADCIKIGMLHRPEVIGAVADVLDAEGEGIPIVLDTVMIAKGGASLLEDAAVEALRERLLPRAFLITPNVPEAEVLAGRTIATAVEAAEAGRDLRRQGPDFVLMKGGHLSGEAVVDQLIGPEGTDRFESPRIDTRHTHGTGCTLASATAAGMAQGLSVRDAVVRARQYVLEAIRQAPGIGAGHGPLNHAHTFAGFEDVSG